MKKLLSMLVAMAMVFSIVTVLPASAKSPSPKAKVVVKTPKPTVAPLQSLHLK